MDIKHCYNCKYCMFGTCLHKSAAHCSHSELWTPIGFGVYDISVFNLPDEIKDLIEIGIYTEEGVLKFIEKHGYTNRLTEYKSDEDGVYAVPITDDIHAIVQKLAYYEDAEQQGRIIILDNN